MTNLQVVNSIPQKEFIIEGNFSLPTHREGTKRNPSSTRARKERRLQMKLPSDDNIIINFLEQKYKKKESEYSEGFVGAIVEKEDGQLKIIPWYAKCAQPVHIKQYAGGCIITGIEPIKKDSPLKKIQSTPYLEPQLAEFIFRPDEHCIDIILKYDFKPDPVQEYKIALDEFIKCREQTVEARKIEDKALEKFLLAQKSLPVDMKKKLKTPKEKKEPMVNWGPKSQADLESGK